MERLEVRLLGPVEVTHGARPIELARPLERALLARLALAPGRAVPTDRLIDDLWGERLPSDPVASLHGLVCRLRRTLEVTGSVVARRDNGYLLDVPADDVDVARFERAMRSARAARNSPVAQQHELLRGALGLWRGDAMDGIGDVPFVAAQRARLAAARLTAIGDRIDAALELGHHMAVVDELHGLVVEHPHQERFWGQLILALYRCGAQADALRCFQQLRSLLAEDLGINPSPAVTRLEHAVLVQDPALDWQPPARPPAPGPPDTTSDQPEPVVLSWSPRSEGGFVGRERELAIAWEARRRAATEPVLVLVTGEPGIGKTRLAAELAARASGAGDLVVHGRWDEEALCPYQAFREALGVLVTDCVDLATDSAPRTHASDLVQVVPEVLEKLERPPASGGSPGSPDLDRYRLFRAVASWVSELGRHRRLVLVLDDLQWADASSLALLEFMLRSPSRTQLLVVAACRQTEADTSSWLAQSVAGLRRFVATEKIALGGLGPGDAEDLFGALLGPTQSDAAAVGARNVHRHTAGNPFFLEAVAQDLRQSDAPLDVWAGAEWNPLPVLGQLRDVVQWRLRLVSASCRLVLSAAAAAGDCFSASVVGRMLGCNEEQLLSALDEARLAALILQRAPTSDDHCFAHAVVRHVLYDDMDGSRRARLRHRLADILETRRDRSTRVTPLTRRLAEAPFRALAERRPGAECQGHRS